MAQGPQGASRLAESPGSLCFGEGSLADVEGGTEWRWGLGAGDAGSGGSCKGVPLLPQPPSPSSNDRVVRTHAEVRGPAAPTWL